MRTNQARKTGPALLDRPDMVPVAPRLEEIRRGPSSPPRPRREVPATDGDRDGFDPGDTAVARNRGRGRRIRRGLIPRTRNGWIAAGVVTAVVLSVAGAAVYTVDHFLHHDSRFRIASSASIELEGNTHLTRSQLLSVFGEDVDGNLFDVPLRERREQLEQMPWVEHATVMRLLPARLRVDVTERTPIAFVRQGGSIGMADRNGVLLDIPPDAPGNPQYSFPVVTGLKADATPPVREQQMHLYSAFLHDLDSSGKKVSADLSEVDLSDPEDLKALLPSAGGAQTLVHFGTGNFLHRYDRFQEHIAEWRAQYPRLNSVDMRYERQVVLQMPPKDSIVGARSDAAAPAHPPTKAEAKAGGLRPVDQRAANGKPPLGTGSSLVEAQPAKAAAPVKPTHFAGTPATKSPNARSSAQQAQLAKRVEKIKAWMARRDKERAKPAQ